MQIRKSIYRAFFIPQPFRHHYEPPKARTLRKGGGYPAKSSSLWASKASNARRYDQLLADTDDLALPVAPPLCGHTYQSYVVRVTRGEAARNRLMEYLHEQGIETRPGTHAPHTLGYYRDKYGIRPEAYPHARDAALETVTLPIFPGMTGDDQAYVVAHVKQGLARGSVEGI